MKCALVCMRGRMRRKTGARSSLILNERIASCLLPEPGLRLRGTSSTTIFSPAVILTPARLLGLI